MKNRGFTLVEILAALLIFTLIIAASLHFFSGAQLFHEKAAGSMRMFAVIRQSVEYLCTRVPKEDSGEMEWDGFRVKWQIVVARKSGKVKTAGFFPRQLQLNRVKLKVFKSRQNRLLHEVSFLVNRVSPGATQ